MKRPGGPSKHPSLASSSACWQKRRCPSPLVALLVVNVLLWLTLLATAVLLMCWEHPAMSPCLAPVARAARDSRADTESEDRHLGTYCSLKKHLDCQREGRGQRVKVKDNKILCCEDLRENVVDIVSSALSSRLASDRRKDKMLNRVKSAITELTNNPASVNIRPACHVGILPNGNTTGPDSDAPRIQWEKSGERSFVSGGLLHGGDRMTVTEVGYYYVYTGLQFNVDPGTVDSSAIVAFLYRNVNGTTDSQCKLMMSRESSCKTTRGDVIGPVSMHMAGVYLLKKGDEISVRTASQSLLHRSSAATYLGIHMV